jgi:hypothetical protein
MSKSRAPFGRGSARGGSFEVLVRPERSPVLRAVGLVWRLRAEIAAVLLAQWVWQTVNRLMPSWAVLVVLVVLLAGVVGWPPTRRFVVSRLWCTVSRHRVRACLVHCRIANRHGYVPWLLWVRPTKVGERVWLLCRPGISVRDFEDRTTQLAAACWARDARVAAWRRLAAVITVDVIRRDPLTADRMVDNPITVSLAEATGSPASDRTAAVLTAVPGRPVEDQQAAPAEGRTGSPVVLAASGEDVSDYV